MESWRDGKARKERVGLGKSRVGVEVSIWLSGVTKTGLPTIRYGFGIANFEERGILKWISSTFQPIL
jgi:hypothetical protein